MKRPKVRNYLALRDSQDTLDLGRLVAEEDDNLAQYYVAPERYLNRALNVDDPAVFFIGPKGTGKSAILKMVELHRSAESDRVISIAPDDLAFSALANVEATSTILGDAANNQWVFKTLWDYVLSLEIYRREYRDENALLAFFAKLVGGKHEADVRKLLSISESASGHSLTQKILQLIKEIELSGEVQGIKLSGRAALNGTSTGKDALHLLSLVNSVAKRVGNDLRHCYYLLIDDLDKYWNNTPTQNAFIAALFTSIRHFNRPPNLKCVVALRNNIYESLPLVDRDKFHDWVCPVSWDHLSVGQMLEQRICFKLSVSHHEIWGGLFPPDAYDTIWNRSNGRPREAIRLATLALKKAATEGHSCITPDDLANAVKDFSVERIRECSDEVKYRFPGIEPLILRMRGWPKQFSMSKIQDLAEVIALEIDCGEGEATRHQWAAGFAANPSGLARILFECGVLWIKLSRTDDPRPYDPQYPIEITPDRWFAVHPMFAPGLGLVGA